MKSLWLRAWAYGSGLLVLAVVFFVFLYILVKGGGVISPEFMLDYPKGIPLGMSGGIFPAIMGSILLGIVAAAVASFFSLATALYLSFYCHNRLIYEVNRFLIQCVSGIPSIVLGRFGYGFFLMDLGLPRSVLSAGLTLAVMIIPFITLRLEKIFREFSRETIEASLDLGISLSYTICVVLLPSCRRAIATTIALASAFAMGATAPIMYTGAVLYTGYVPDLTDPFMALPYHLYILVNDGYSVEMAYGTAFVLIALLLLINLLCQSLKERKA